jgi:glycogen operon protein
VRRLIAIRRAHPVFRRRDFFQGRPLRGGGVKDIVWLTPDGAEMSDHGWEHEFARCLGVYLAGDGLSETDARGQPVTDRSFIVLFNAHHEQIAFRLPEQAGPLRWFTLLDTARADGLAGSGTFPAGAAYPLQGRSLALLVQSHAPG